MRPPRTKIKVIAAFLFLFYVAFLLPRASATLAPFGPSTQNVIFTGLGGDASGAGRSRVTWGSCVYDGTNTTCTVTAPFIGFSGGGTINLVVSYPGNGPSPLTAISKSSGNDRIFFNLSSGSFVVKLLPNSGPPITFYFPNFVFDFINATCTSVSPCGVGQEGLTPNATITGPITGTFDPTPIITTPLGVISASAYGGYSALSPGSWMEIYGTNLATVISQAWAAGDFKGNLAPNTLAGTTVSIGGMSAFIDFVSPGQVNAQVPSNVATGPQPVVVTTAGGSSVAFTIMVNSLEPGLLAPNVFKLPAGQYVAAFFPDARTLVLPPIPGVPTARAQPGDILTFYGLGFGPVTPDSPAGLLVTQANQLNAHFEASFAGVPATVQFSGLVAGYLGLYQFNVVVPKVDASDSVPFSYSLNGVKGPQNLIIAIRD